MFGRVNNRTKGRGCLQDTEIGFRRGIMSNSENHCPSHP